MGFHSGQILRNRPISMRFRGPAFAHLRDRMGAEPATFTSQGHAAYVRLFSDASWALAPAIDEHHGARSWRSRLTAQLPGSSTPAITLLALFTAVQLLD